MNIQSVHAHTIFDSRGNPTIECEIVLADGSRGVGIVPSGASTGQYEAHELRDGDPARFRGKAVFKAIDNIHNHLAPAIIGMDVTDLRAIDERMIGIDGTPNKSRLGANAILAISMGAAVAAANHRKLPLHASLGGGHGTLLPLPEIQIIGGGAHANWRTDIQDFMLIATGAETFAEVMEITFNVYHTCGDILKKRNRYYGLADEGGFWPEFGSNEEALQLLVEAIETAGYTPGLEASISLDIAASDLFDEATRKYHLRLDNRELDSDGFVDLMIDWCERYPVVSIEDPAADTDLGGWKRFNNALGGRMQVIGDDLFTTNPQRIRQGMAEGLANSVLIKLNQIGTVTETLDAIALTKSAGWAPVISARSGETEDAFISHLAVATNAGQLKVGSFARSERMVKWNEVLRIERQLGAKARFEGKRGLPFA